MQETTTQTEVSQFDLEAKFRVYLSQMGMDPATMPAEQYKDVRRTFLHACGKMLHLFLFTIAFMPDKEASDAVYNMVDQVDRFTFQDIAEEYKAMSGGLREYFTKDPTRKP